MSVRKTIDQSVFFGAVLGSLVLVNIVGLWLFGRLDLTRDNQFTLSRASEKVLRRSGVAANNADALVLMAESVLNRVWILRQLLHPLNVIDAMEFLRDKIAKTEYNKEFVESMST